MQQSAKEGEGVGEEEIAKRQDKPGEMLLPVQEDEPVVEEGPVEPDLQEVILKIWSYVSPDFLIFRKSYPTWRTMEMTECSLLLSFLGVMGRRRKKNTTESERGT